MIFHNRYLTITEQNEMGPYTFDNLKDWEDFGQKVELGDIIITGKNFGSGSSRQQAVDCFKALGVSAILAKSFGSIYERNAINAALPILKYDDISCLALKQRDKVRIDFKTGAICTLETGKSTYIQKFSKVQMEIYKRDGLLTNIPISNMSPSPTTRLVSLPPSLSDTASS
jgi:3-isopropylmalate dehydratase small subunit